MMLEVRRRAREQGSALLLTLVVLFLVSALGVGLALTTTTETDIARNYRYGELAFCSADAGLEYGKNVLAAYALRDGDFRQALPPPRSPGSMNRAPSAGQGRDDETFYREGSVRVYIGQVIFDPGNGRRLESTGDGPGNLGGDLDGDGRPEIEGSITLWVRRPVAGRSDYGFTDDKHDRAIVTAEATAPDFGAYRVGGPLGRRRLEMSLRLVPGFTRDGFLVVPPGGEEGPPPPARFQLVVEDYRVSPF
jgi:hypothetical protein